MLSKAELWDFIEALLSANTDLALYDLELPKGKGTLNIYITKQINSDQSEVKVDSALDENSGQGLKVAGITHDDCTLVSKLLDECTELDYLRNDAGMVVSSPGVNRALKRKEHFENAVGERVKVSYRDQTGVSKNAVGVLKDFNGQQLFILREIDPKEQKQSKNKGTVVTGEIAEIALEDVNKAQIDFLF